MLGTLLKKDLRRAWRNPWPYIINLSLPICLTALIGLAMGGCSKSKSLGLIKVAVVDEDNSVFSSLLRGALNQGEAKKYLELQFASRDEAMGQINRNKISAVLIIPRNFSQDYLSGATPAALDLVKNPAQTIYPAIVEELLGVGTAGLNAIVRNVGADLPEWRTILESKKWPDMKQVAKLVERIGDRFEAAREYLFPPLVTYSKEVKQKAKSSQQWVGIFGYLLPGMAAMFLLFLADNAVRDLYTELRIRTFDRFRTLRTRVLSFVLSKVVLAMTILLISSAILFIGGAFMFQITWPRPAAMVMLILAYSLCAAGLMALIAAVAKTERRADVLNSAIILGLAFVGGSMFPVRQLPAVFRDFISPWLPNNWFAEAVRDLNSASAHWELAVVKLVVAGIVFIVVASWHFERTLAKGIRD